MSWISDAQTMVGHTGFLLGIVAAVMAIILAYVRQNELAVGTLSLFAISLGVFLIAAEQFSESANFNDHRRYMKAIRLYNLGVVLMLWGMALLTLIFQYVIPTLILVVFSFYWIREIARTTLIRRPTQ